MYRKDLKFYDHLVDVLRDAYMKDELRAGQACGCAVGNIVKAAFISKGYPESMASSAASSWMTFFTCSTSIGEERLMSVIRTDGVHTQFRRSKVSDPNAILEHTGLPEEVLMDIEWAFETNQVGNSTDEMMFNGLMAVIEVLDKYFEIEPVKKEETKKVFMKTTA